MKLQKSTLSLLIIAILLGGIVYFAESRRNNFLEQPQQQSQKLFNFSEKDIQRIVIKNPTETLAFERTDNQQPWKMTQPEKTIANDAVIVFLLNLLVEAESDRQFTIPPSQQKEYGFDPPFSQITITLKNQKTHTLVLGNSDFQDQLIYAQVDPLSSPQSELTVILVPQNFQYAVERELSEWKESSPTQENVPQSSDN